MSTVYLTATQGKLTKRGETLVLHLDENTVKTIFPFKTEQLVLVGNIDISTPALKFLMRHNIDTVFINKNGKYNGRLSFGVGKNVFLRMKQYELWKNEKFRLEFSRSVAMAKIKNQLLFGQRIGRREREVPNYKDKINRLKNSLRGAEKADNIDSLRGYEGNAARTYFGLFKHAFISDIAVFNGRSMNPPEDNVNAVLSFIYTIILNRIITALEINGLDPYIGFYHAVEYGRHALAFDLMEEFRVPLADSLTVALFNLGVLGEDDFREVDFSSENDEFPLEESDEYSAVERKKGVLLNREGLRKVITQMEKKLDNEIYYGLLQKKISYKKLILEQIHHFKRVINGEEKEYKPLVVK